MFRSQFTYFRQSLVKSQIMKVYMYHWFHSRVSHFRKSCQMIMHIWHIVMHADLRSCANFHFFSQSFWSPAKHINFTWRNVQKYKYNMGIKTSVSISRMDFYSLYAFLILILDKKKSKKSPAVIFLCIFEHFSM